MVARFGAKLVFGSRVLMGAKSECFVARLFEKMVSGSRVLVGSKSGRFGGSLRREFDFRESAVGGRNVTAFWKVALGSRLWVGAESYGG